VLERLERMWQSRPGVLGWVMTTDHKRIGLLYFWTTLVLFAAGGAEALLIRTQLASRISMWSDRPPSTSFSPCTG